MLQIKNFTRILNLFEEKYLTIDQQNDIFINRRNFQLKYYQFNFVVKFLIILNSYLKMKEQMEEDVEYKEIFNDLINDSTNKLNNFVQLHKKFIDENKNQIK